MLPFMEQQPLFNATNFNLTSSNVENLTISGTTLNSLLCPSDTNTVPTAIASGMTGAFWNQVFPLPPGTWNQAFTSYGGNAGWYAAGYVTNFASPTELGQYNGVIFNDSVVSIAQITDGTSNTMAFCEHSHGNNLLYDFSFGISDNCWPSGKYYDTMIATMWPPNLPMQGGGVTNPVLGTGNYFYSSVAQSFHAGGVNVGFCDGSVRFVKNTVNSWALVNPTGYKNHYMPANMTYSSFVYTSTGVVPGVWQALSSRNVGEVIDMSSY
jgi:prepilin-type processing-associated H-X9-DG protein